MVASLHLHGYLDLGTINQLDDSSTKRLVIVVDNILSILY